MSALSDLVDKLSTQSPTNLNYNITGELVNQKRKEIANRLPNLDSANLNILAIFLQATDITRLSNTDLTVIAESGLNHLEYTGSVTQLNKLLTPDQPSFDVNGIVVNNNNISYADLHKYFRRAVAVNKSLNKDFQTTYLTNI